MVQQAFLTLRRGVIERICPVELQNFSLDELKTRLVNLAGTMSKERLRSYAEDEDLSHSSDSYETDTPTEQSDSDLEMVDDEEVLEQIAAEKREAEEREMELRERLARKIIEKKFFQRKKEIEAEQAKALEEGEILSDGELALAEIPIPIGAAPEPPQLDFLFIPPPPPPLAESPSSVPNPVNENHESQPEIILTYDEPTTKGTENDIQTVSEDSTEESVNSPVDADAVKTKFSWEVCYDDGDDLGEDPEIDLF
uniref:Uncharacterized protein n=1 Tax=Panagrolaimus sp. JU765 TaxID=591449 RepID=A0AC34RE96_9BILA